MFKLNGIYWFSAECGLFFRRHVNPNSEMAIQISYLIIGAAPVATSNPPSFFDDPVVQGAAWIINICSIAYAWWQAKDSKKMADRLVDISNSLTTKYLGEFPDFMDLTIELIEKAEKEILIVCDYPCYGYFSSHDKWIDYSQAIVRKIKKSEEHKVNVSIKFLTAKKRRDLMAMQFRYEPTNPNNWKSGNNPAFQKRLKRLLDNPPNPKSSTPVPNIDDVKFEDLQRLLEEANGKAIDNDFVGATILETDHRLPIYFWVVDNKEAIFSIPSFVEYDSEKGFRTTDQTLIEALTKGQQSTAWRQAIGLT